jgi:hypothetical protein
MPTKLPIAQPAELRARSHTQVALLVNAGVLKAEDADQALHMLLDESDTHWFCPDPSFYDAQLILL